MSAAPQLRGLLKTQLKRDFAITVGLCVVFTAAMKVFVKDARKAKYENFYK